MAKKASAAKRTKKAKAATAAVVAAGAETPRAAATLEEVAHRQCLLESASASLDALELDFRDLEKAFARSETSDAERESYRNQLQFLLDTSSSLTATLEESSAAWA